MLVCSQCGELQDEGRDFCSSCGAPLTPTLGNDADAQRALPQEPAPDSDVQEAAVQPEETADAPIAAENDRRKAQADTEDDRQAAVPEADGALQGNADEETAASAQPHRAAHCVQCGSKVPPDGMYCAVCGAKIPELPPNEDIIPVSPAYYRAPDNYPPQPEKKKRNGAKIALAAAIAVVAVAVLALVGVGLYNVMNIHRVEGVPPDFSARAILYVKDGESLRYKTKGLESAQVITDSYYYANDYEETLLFGMHAISADGTQLLYLNDVRYDSSTYNTRGDLYLRDLTVLNEEGQPADRGKRIATDVKRFMFTPDASQVLYLTSKDDLHVWNGTQSRKIDSNVTDLYDYDNETILYYKGDSSGYNSSEDIYMAFISAADDVGREKIETDIYRLIDWTDDHNKFVFIKTAREKDEEQLYDVYWYDRSAGQKDILIKDVSEVVDADASDGSVLYLIPQPATFSLSSILDDDMLEGDAKLTKPNLEDYPNLYQYENYNWYSDDFDYESFDYEAFYDEYYAYEEAMELYESKAYRDELRAYLSGEVSYYSDFNFNLYTLHLLKDSDRKKIDGDIFKPVYNSGVVASLEVNTACYLRLDSNSINKIKMSDINDSLYSYSFDIQDYLQENAGGDLYFTYLDQAPVRLSTDKDQGTPNPYSFIVTEDKAGLYFTTTKKDSSSYYGSSYGSYYDQGYKTRLYYYALNDSAAKPELVDSDAYYGPYQQYGDKMFYLSKARDDTCDLYILDGAERERILFDVSSSYSPEVYNGGKTILYFEDYDYSREMGDLYLYDENGEKKMIAEDVYEYFYRSDDLVYVMCNYRSGRADLYSFNGETVSLVDYDVTSVFSDWLDESSKDGEMGESAW